MINLINSKTGFSPQLLLIEDSIRRASRVAIVLFLLIGLSLGGLYMYFSSKKESLERTRMELRSEITANKNREGLLTSIKDRTRIVERVSTSQRPWVRMLNLLGEVAAPPVLAGVSVNEGGVIETTIQGSSFDELASPVTSLISTALDGKIKNPVLRSVQVGKDGTVRFSITFSMVF